MRKIKRGDLLTAQALNEAGIQITPTNNVKQTGGKLTVLPSETGIFPAQVTATFGPHSVEVEEGRFAKVLKGRIIPLYSDFQDDRVKYKTNPKEQEVEAYSLIRNFQVGERVYVYTSSLTGLYEVISGNLSVGSHVRIIAHGEPTAGEFKWKIRFPGEVNISTFTFPYNATAQEIIDAIKSDPLWDDEQFSVSRRTNTQLPNVSVSLQFNVHADLDEDFEFISLEPFTLSGGARIYLTMEITEV